VISEILKKKKSARQKTSFNQKLLEVQGGGAPTLLNMLSTVCLEPLLRAKSQPIDQGSWWPKAHMMGIGENRKIEPGNKKEDLS